MIYVDTDKDIGPNPGLSCHRRIEGIASISRIASAAFSDKRLLLGQLAPVSGSHKRQCQRGQIIAMGFV